MKIEHHDDGRAYATRRATAYPALSDQLDALWHAMHRGDLPMVPAFYEPIAAVKAANPKPEVAK